MKHNKPTHIVEAVRISNTAKLAEYGEQIKQLDVYEDHVQQDN
jgi:hypothetical protein